LRRLAASVVAVALAAGLSSGARADIVYAFASQTISGLSVSPVGITSSSFTGSATSADAASNGSGVSTNNPTDTLQSYIGAAPPAPQNFFARYSSFVATSPPGPQAGDFTRGDALLVTPANLFTTGATTSNVAESYISTGGLGVGLQTATGSWSLGGQFTVPTTTTAVTVNYSFANDILAFATSPVSGMATAAFKATISIKDQHGNEVDATPSNINTAISSPPNSPELITSGASTAVLSLLGLTLTDTLSITISGTETTSASLAVPEPGPIALGAVAGFGALAVGAVRRRSRRITAK